jgi:tellurite resistance protein TerC
MYIFGGFLIYTAMKMLFSGEDEKFEPKNHSYKALKSQHAT